MIDIDKVVTLDFETYFDADYTLKKLSTSAYIRDDRFKAQCVGIKLGRDNVLWIPDVHVEEALRSIDWSDRILLAHHTQFDGFILTDRYDLRPLFYLDTLSMGRGLHSVGVGAGLNDLAIFYELGNKLPDVLDKTKGVRDWSSELMQEAGTYCAVDTQLCFDLFLAMLPKYTEAELGLIDQTVRMFCEPVLKIDIPVAERALELERTHKARQLEAARRDPADLRSNEKFANILRSLGVEPPMKISPTTGKPTYAFSKSDQGFQELEIHDDDAVRAIVAARKAVKSTLGETRALRLIQESGTNDRSIPVYLKYYGAHTGRWSAGNKMNLQNLPRIYKDDPDSGLLRKSLLAPPGYVLCVADSSQIEARTLVWLAGDQEVVDQFANGDDVYVLMASIIFKKPVDQITKRERFVGKVAILGLGYGMGWRKFLLTVTLGLMGPKMDMEASEAQNVVTTYRMARGAVKAFWAACDEMLENMMYAQDGVYKDILHIEGSERKIWLPNEMYLEYPGLSLSGNGYIYFNYEYAQKIDAGRVVDPAKGKKIYGGLLTENITQALARIVIGEQLLKVSERYKIVTTTHDEIVALVPEQEADEGLEFMLDVMRTRPSWAPDLPLDAEGGYAREYSK